MKNLSAKEKNTAIRNAIMREVNTLTTTVRDLEVKIRRDRQIIAHLQSVLKKGTKPVTPASPKKAKEIKNGNTKKYKAGDRKRDQRSEGAGPPAQPAS